MNVHHDGGSHHGHGGHVQQPVTNGYDAGTHQIHQQQAVDGYQVGNAVEHHHHSVGHGHDHNQAKNLGTTCLIINFTPNVMNKILIL